MSLSKAVEREMMWDSMAWALTTWILSSLSSESAYRMLYLHKNNYCKKAEIQGIYLKGGKGEDG